VETKAVARYIRISPRKARLVVDMIRGRDLAAAEQILDFSDKGAARVVSKVLRSAAANAENNNGLAAEGLFVSKVFVDEGPTLKRFRPRAMGRATRINKRTCHITVILDEREPQKVTSRRRRRKAEKAAVTEAATLAEAQPEEPSVTETQPKAEWEEPSDKKTAGKKPSRKQAGKAETKKPAAKPAAKKPAAVTEAELEAQSEEPSDEKRKSTKKPPSKKPAAKKSAPAKPNEKATEDAGGASDLGKDKSSASKEKSEE
jgi:large subunit ribosomal protein L22